MRPRPENSTPQTRAKNGRKRTASIKGAKLGTKAKRAARAKARRAAKIKRRGSTSPKLRVTKDTLDKFVRDQKRRRVDPIDERFTATLLGALTAARGGGMPPKLAAPSGPRTAPEKYVRDRTKMRASGMRFEHKPDSAGQWTYANGKNGSQPKIGYARVKLRRQFRKLMHNLNRDTEKLIEIGEDVARTSVGLGA